MHDAARELRLVGDELLELVRARGDLARLRMERRALRLALYAWLALLGGTATVLGAYYGVRGWVGAWRAALGTPWVGDLVAALLLLAALTGSVLVAHRARAKARLERLRREPDTPAGGDER